MLGSPGNQAHPGISNPFNALNSLPAKEKELPTSIMLAPKNHGEYRAGKKAETPYNENSKLNKEHSALVLALASVDDSQPERKSDLISANPTDLQLSLVPTPTSDLPIQIRGQDLGLQADVEDNEMIEVETRGIKGRLQEDVTHTPDRGDASKKRHTLKPKNNLQQRAEENAGVGKISAMHNLEEEESVPGGDVKILGENGTWPGTGLGNTVRSYIENRIPQSS
ncbi:hypothetical protein R1sor_011238 [Riccia sorocarpa]|uniref:Uncharacterized protein n=1 Tax=Riccia sorocarpa TaxID=122646 RepID=A0ABD3I327_9MARC